MTAFRISLRGAPRRCGLALLLLAAAVPPAAAQSTGDRLERIEREIGALQRYVYSGGGGGAGGGSGGAADPAYRERVEVRINSLEGEVRDLTGRVEELNHSVRRLQDRLDKLVQDVDFRLTAMERAAQGGGGGAVGAPPPTAPRASAAEPSPPAVAPAAPRGASSAPSEPSRSAALPTGSAMELYDHARQLLSQTRYDEAEAAFREFLQRYPNNALTENARYWLGETYYVRKRYDDAAAAFLDGYQKHPKGSKAADNLLKLGLSLSALQKGPEACVALDKLIREYPNADSYILRRAEQERGQLRCG
mgnify:CR=1 FL=1